MEILKGHTTEAAEIVKASGRACCRVCGQKIAKGEKSVRFFFSIHDGGSYNPWQAVTGNAHIHCYKDYARNGWANYGDRKVYEALLEEVTAAKPAAPAPVDSHCVSCMAVIPAGTRACPECAKTTAALKDERHELRADIQNQKSVSSCLRDELAATRTALQACDQERERLKAQNAELLAALKRTQSCIFGTPAEQNEAYNIAAATIAKAEGGN